MCRIVLCVYVWVLGIMRAIEYFSVPLCVVGESECTLLCVGFLRPSVQWISSYPIPIPILILECPPIDNDHPALAPCRDATTLAAAFAALPGPVSITATFAST